MTTALNGFGDELIRQIRRNVSVELQGVNRGSTGVYRAVDNLTYIVKVVNANRNAVGNGVAFNFVGTTVVGAVIVLRIYVVVRGLNIILRYAQCLEAANNGAHNAVVFNLSLTNVGSTGGNT